MQGQSLNLSRKIFIYKNNSIASYIRLLKKKLFFRGKAGMNGSQMGIITLCRKTNKKTGHIGLPLKMRT